jgi:hypothetical protein
MWSCDVRASNLTPLPPSLNKEGGTEKVGWLVFFGVFVVSAGILVVIDVGMLRFATFAPADYYGIAVLVALAVFVSSYSVLIAGAVRVVVGVPVVARIGIATVVATIRIAASIAAITAVVTVVVAVVIAIRMVPITAAAAVGASCCQG